MKSNLLPFVAENWHGVPRPMTDCTVTMVALTVFGVLFDEMAKMGERAYVGAPELERGMGSGGR